MFEKCNSCLNHGTKCIMFHGICDPIRTWIANNDPESSGLTPEAALAAPGHLDWGDYEAAEWYTNIEREIVEGTFCPRFVRP